MLRATIRGMLHRKLRLFLSGLAVVLGVMFVSGALILTDLLGRSFDQMFAGAYEHTDVRVHGEPKVAVSELDGGEVPVNLPADVVDTVAAVPGVAAATGLVEADGARVVGADGTVVASFGLPRMGISWTGEDELRRLREGRGPTAPDEIAIDAALAQTAGLSVGDRVGVLTLQPLQEFTLVGIFGFGPDRDTIGGVQHVAFTDQVAQQLMLGEPDVWTTVDVRAAGGVRPEQVRDDIAATLGDGYLVRTGAELADQQSQQRQESLGFFNDILLGFAAVALFVGAFLILNTFSIVVAQRTRELALTRAIGASRRQVIASVLLEAAAIGLVASAVGVAAGLGVGVLMASIAAGLVSLPLAGPALPASAVIAALAVGVLVTLVAAVVPAQRAARVPPIAAIREAASPDRSLARLTLAGAVTIAAGGAALGLGLTGTAGGQELAAVLGGVLLCFVGVALLTPLAARPVVSGIGRLFSWSVPGKLGRLNSGRNPRRTAITAAALMIGLAIVTGVGVILESAKHSIGGFAADSVDAELVITGSDSTAGVRRSVFDGEVLAEAARLPGVARVVGIHLDLAELDGDREVVFATSDPAAFRDTFGLTAESGSLAPLAADQLVLDSRTAADRALAVGDRLRVQLSRGETRTYRLAGVYEWTPLWQGTILPPEAIAGFDTPQPDTGLVKLSDGAGVDDVRPAVAALLAGSPEVSVVERSGWIDEETSQLDQLLTVVQLLLALAILIAVLGVVNTLALSVLERTRELGLLRAVGLGRAATMRMVTVEAVLISIFGALLGVAVGVGLGAAVVSALDGEGITRLALPWRDLGAYLLLGAVVGVIAAALPAIRAARTNVLTAIAYE